ncbi:MAG: PadR family transcriptional regulator [Candidatus Thorarchaeota archaeon]
MQNAEQAIAGPLQARVLVTLREEPICGVDLMDRLVISSPGTIYPVLDSLRTKQLVECRTEEKGAIRRKVYFLTQFGEEQLHEYLTVMVDVFCSDMHTHIDKILEQIRDFLDVSHRQKVLCTLDYEGIRQFLQGNKVTFSHNLLEVDGSFDVIVNFLGAGCILKNSHDEISDYLRSLVELLQTDGTLACIEIERTNNIFARFFFEKIFGLEVLPGLDKKDLEKILEGVGFKDIQLISMDGLLFAFCKK